MFWYLYGNGTCDEENRYDTYIAKTEYVDWVNHIKQNLHTK